MACPNVPGKPLVGYDFPQLADVVEKIACHVSRLHVLSIAQCRPARILHNNASLSHESPRLFSLRPTMWPWASSSLRTSTPWLQLALYMCEPLQEEILARTVPSPFKRPQALNLQGFVRLPRMFLSLMRWPPCSTHKQSREA